MGPRFSIIVPVYNTARYLDKCIRSLLAQTLEGVEVILVDDGSTDGSGRICDSYASGKEKTGAQIKVIHKKNEGQGIARNAGLDAAQGRYVLFIDSDDTIERDTCSRLYHYMEDNGLQLCSFGYVIEDGEGKEFYRPKIRERMFRGEEIRERFILHFFGDSPEEDELRGVSACMSAFDRSVIEEFRLRFPSEREVLSEDTVFSLDFCRHIRAAAVLPAFFYHYYQNPESFSHSYRPDRLPMTRRLCTILEEYAAIYGVTDKAAVRIRMVLWVSLMECIKQEVGRRDASRETIYGNVRDMCQDEMVQRSVWTLRPRDLNLKQRILLHMVRRKWVSAVIWMAELRNRKGL